jgi:hypothetical protein
MNSSIYLTIPHQAFEVAHVHLTPFQLDRFGKSIARLTYKDHSIDFHDVSILSPPVRVLDYNPDNSRLRVDLSDHPLFLNKLQHLYENLIHTFYIHQQGFLQTVHSSLDDIRHLFYYLMDGPILSLYVYPTAQVMNANGKEVRMAEIKAGDLLRCVIRFQGVTQLHNRDGLRLRLHHSIPALYRIPISG